MSSDARPSNLGFPYPLRFRPRRLAPLVKLIAEGDELLRSGVLLILNRFGPRAASRGLPCCWINWLKIVIRPS